MTLSRSWLGISSNHAMIDHCLDIIRQYIQCAGITTLVPTRYYDGIRRNYIDSDQLHTCRSFRFLREWTTNRSPGGSAYAERDLSVVDAEKHRLAREKMAEMSNMAAGVEAEP